MANTKPPVSQPVDHERWTAERKRIDDAIRGDGEGMTIKIRDPILDSRWAVILGSLSCALLSGIGVYMFNKMENFSAKQDAFLIELSQLNTRIGIEGAERAVIKAQMNAIEQRVGQHDVRIERLELAK